MLWNSVPSVSEINFFSHRFYLYLGRPDSWVTQHINTLRPRQNGCCFADDTFKRIFLNENVRISIKISLKFVPKGPINNNPALVQIMAWRRSGDKPLSEPMIVSLLTHIWVTRPQWVKTHPCCKFDDKYYINIKIQNNDKCVLVFLYHMNLPDAGGNSNLWIKPNVASGQMFSISINFGKIILSHSLRQN